MRFARDRATIAIYDIETATNVNRRLADAVEAKSAAFVPLISEGRVAGVLVAATRSERRDFSSAELDVVAGLILAGHGREVRGCGGSLDLDRFSFVRGFVAMMPMCSEARASSGT